MHIVYLSVSDNTKKDQAILLAIKKQKHTAINRAFSDKTVNKQNHIAQTIKEIKKSDGIVVECSSTNFDLGRLLTLSLLQHKPVLLLEQKGLETEIELGESRLVTKKTYRQNDDKSISASFEKFIQIIEKQRLSYRFNLMLSGEIDAHLLSQSLKRNISKADYIRSLILADMS